MKLLLNRQMLTDRSTIGQLFVDGVFECFTLEPPLAALAPTCPHPAIPPGTYALGLHNSPKFGSWLVELLDVPGRSDILIHAGNFASDTLGCIVVGKSHAHDSVRSSRIALAELQPRIVGALERGEAGSLTIVNQPHEEKRLA